MIPFLAERFEYLACQCVLRGALVDIERESLGSLSQYRLLLLAAGSQRFGWGLRSGVKPRNRLKLGLGREERRCLHERIVELLLRCGVANASSVSGG